MSSRPEKILVLRARQLRESRSRSCRSNSVPPGEIGGVISLGGVTIAAGDLLIGDIDGVVVVPRGDVRAAGAELKAIADKEAKKEAAVKSGASFPAWLDDVLASDRIRYVD